MNIDLKSIFINQFTSMFEHIIWLIPIALSIAISLFVYRRELAYELNLTRREQNRLSEKSLLAIIIIIGITIAYLYIKEYFFLLAITLSVILTYFLYQVGILDLIIKWWEDRYGR